VDGDLTQALRVHGGIRGGQGVVARLRQPVQRLGLGEQSRRRHAIDREGGDVFCDDRRRLHGPILKDLIVFHIFMSAIRLSRQSRFHASIKFTSKIGTNFTNENHDLH
jgi:hypothetical protein